MTSWPVSISQAPAVMATMHEYVSCHRSPLLTVRPWEILLTRLERAMHMLFDALKSRQPLSALEFSYRLMKLLPGG
jgi:hypothetical protein